MKRYLLFGGDCYYPAGGWDDFMGAFDTFEEARQHAGDHPADWQHVVDTETMKSTDLHADPLNTKES